VELKRPRVLALVLAGGEGGRLGDLTEERAKPALPYGGVYRLIDFPLSNCRHSGIGDVWVLQQFQPHSLTEHLANGRPWDLDRTHGGLRVLHPSLGGSGSESGWYEGNADALFRNKEDIRKFEPELLLVLSADHVYKLDYGDVIEGHLERGALATLVTTQVARDDASRFGLVEVEGGRVVDFVYKPDEPKSDLAAAEVFVYDAEKVLATLEELSEGDDDSGLEDFGDELLPHLVEQGSVFEHRLDGHWRDVGTIESYWEGHMELLGSSPAVELDDPRWPILTWAAQRPPAYAATSAQIEDSLVSPGCRVAGQVIRSVLGPGVSVEEGAVVSDSVVFHDTEIRSGASVERAIVDERAEISGDVGSGDEIAVVPRAARIE
jgi:glucose-1-phosphate adenylyltransferase